METYSRMRPFLKRNYRGSDHKAVAANLTNKAETIENIMNTSNAITLAAEAILTEPANEDDENRADDLKGSTSDMNHKENQEILSVPVEQTLQVSVESSTPSVHDERIILELSSSMVQPLRVVRGSFQVSSRYEDLTSFFFNLFLFLKWKCSILLLF